MSTKRKRQTPPPLYRSPASVRRPEDAPIVNDPSPDCTAVVVPAPWPSPQRSTPPPRYRLPPERDGHTAKFTIGGVGTADPVRGYITVSTYPDGTLGEVFVKIDKQGSLASGFADCWAISVSLLLQIGVPIEKIIEKYKGARFEPAGFTGNPEIPIAQSVVDYVVRWLELRFVKPHENKES